MKYLTFISVAFLSLTVIIGCSSASRNPINPSSAKNEMTLPVLDNETDNINRTFLGGWTISFNPETLNFTTSPNREMAVHYNVKSLIPNPVIQIINYDPIRGVMDIDITIKNPYAFDVYDLRLIVFSDNYGVRLLNPDAWTALFDIPGGASINPFRAYAKSDANRQFRKQSQYTERVQLYLPAGSLSVTFAIDASYPNNCSEPYSISNFTQIGNLIDTSGASAALKVEVLDWQNDVNQVSLYCPLVTGVTLLPFNQISSNTWETTIVNNTGASIGNYIGYIYVTSSNSGTLALYDDVMITVTKGTGWARTWGGTGVDNTDDIALDASNNLFTAGWFHNSVDFDPGPGVVTLASNGSNDIYFSKFDQNGNFNWVKAIGGSGDDAPFSIEIDHAGNIFICGKFQGTVDFDPGQGVSARSSFSGDWDSFLVKFDNDGNFKWVKTWGGINGDWGYELAVNSSNEVFIAGVFCEVVDFNPDAGVDSHASNGECDAFLSKYNENGDYQWTLTWGGTGGDDARWIDINDNDELYITGVFCDQVDFNPFPGQDIRNSNGDFDFYLSKFDSTPNFLWTRTWGGVGQEQAQCVRVDINGDVLVCGQFRNSVDFDPGSGEDLHVANGGDVCLSKFAPNGNFLWAETWGTGSNEIARGMGTDSASNIYLTGYWMNDFAFVYKVKPSGETDWERIWGNAPYISGGNTVNKDCTERIYVVGSFTGVLDFDPGSGYDWHTSNGFEDAYLMKLFPNGYWE